MTQIPPASRRQSAQRRGMPPPRKKKKSRAGTIVALAACAAALVLLVLVCPWEPVSHAMYSVGSEDGSAQVGTLTNAYDGLRISELMTSNQGSVPDDKGEYPDWVEVWNSSDRDISLAGVGLSDRGDSIRFLFPDVTLKAGERTVVYCDDTNQAEAGKAFHAKFKLSSVGETVYLFDPSAYTIDQVTTPIMASDSSWALLPDGTWAEVTYVSPGYENTEAGAESYRVATTVTDGAIVINEVMADALTGLTDEDGELSDWIELYNTTDQVVSLKNYALSDKENRPLKWRFPEDAVIAPHGYYIVFCSGKDRDNGASGVSHTNFAISAEHDTVILSDSRGRMVDRVIVDNLAEDCSYGRDENNNWKVFQTATPGLPNNQSGMNQMDRNLIAMNTSGVYITEVMASDDSVAVSGGNYVDWVEIYNSSQSTVDLSGFGLTNRLTRARKWQFPAGTMIQPGEYKVILLDGNSALTTTSELHASFKLARAGGDVVCLSDPTGKILDKVILPLIPTNISYGRTTGLSGFFYYDSPTPMAANGTGFVGYAETPQLTVEPGLHYETVYAGITIPEGTQVYYTLDGSVPTQQDTLYQGETLELNFTTVIRARAFRQDGYMPSDTVTGTYFINAYHSLPIVSLVADPDDLWNPETGILTVGDNVDKSDGIPFKNTVYRYIKEETDMGERAGNVEYYLLDGTQVLNQGMEFGLQGQYSLDMPQKTFKVRAKSLYGAKTFQAALFDDRPFTEYKSFVLRISGNDAVWTRLLDGFQSRMMDAYGSQVIHQAWNPVVVYLNGTYWGHYNMRERVDRFFVAQHEGLSLDEADQMTILEANSTVNYGSNKEYLEMRNKIKEGDPANNPEDLQYILDNVDVDNYFEYLAFEMFFGNSDPGNIRFYKLNQEGAKWKWIFYDSDYGMYNSQFNSPRSYTKESGMGEKNINNVIFLKLLSVPEYKDKFLLKLADIYKTFTTEYMLSILEPMVDQIEAEMPLHFARWAEETDPAIISEVPNTPDAALRYWEGRIDRLRNTCTWRPHYLWGYIKDAFELTDQQMIDYFGEQPPLEPDAE